MSALPAIPAPVSSQPSQGPSQDPPAGPSVFPAEYVVVCAIGDCFAVNGKINAVPRLCESPADLTSWICPYCGDRDVYDEPAHEGKWMSGYIEPYARRYFQTLKPRALDNTQRAYPAWVYDSVQFAAVCDNLRKQRNEVENMRLVYLYWKVGASTREIAEELHTSVKAIEMRLERIKAKAQEILAARRP